ncbi:integrase family protein [Thioalkalivibrio thiocyanodenitrificans]|uniref:integrase family protein n=1 Tax=Thioalkalivibrio thiocyanodenitrificans TaxID=243063 RepID=UPI0003A47B27|nr:integrase family protein [Thioalkalivibrio thiocyanodenitrificans]
MKAQSNRDRLTLARIDAFQCPPGKQQVFLRDTLSPRLAVRATQGGKAFVFEGTLDGKLIRITLGDCRDWPLESTWSGKGANRKEIQRGARQEAARLQSMVDQGIDPREAEREQKAARAAKRAEQERVRKEAEARAKHTTRALLEAYSRHLEAKGKRASAAATRTMFERHVFTPFPEVADKPARDVAPLEIAAIVRRVMEKGKERTAGALRSYLSAAYNAAARAPFDARLPSDLIPFAVEVNPVQPIAAIPVKPRDRTLTPDELRAYMNGLGDELADQALRLALYAGGQRIAQLLRARVEDWSPDTKTMRLFDAKGRRQTPREHLLPLAPKAAAMVSDLVTRAKEQDAPHLFFQRRRRMDAGTPGKRLAEIAAAMGGEPFTVADVRRTCETLLAGMGISREIRAQLLSHGLAGVQVAHYDRHSYADEKRRALAKWERRLAAIAAEKPAKVVNIRGGK